MHSAVAAEEEEGEGFKQAHARFSSLSRPISRYIASPESPPEKGLCERTTNFVPTLGECELVDKTAVKALFPATSIDRYI